MGRQSFELQRADSLCPSKEIRLLDHVTNNQIDEIKKLIRTYPKLLSQVYEHPFYKTILQIACSNLASQIRPKTIQTLIDLSREQSELETTLYYLNDHFDNKQVLHFAAESGDPEILRVILSNIDKKHINDVSDNGNSALHCLINDCEKDDEEAVAECVKLLIESGIDVNRSDSKDLPPIFYAARKGRKEVVNAILTNSQEVDLDSHKFRGKSARDYIEDKKLYDGDLPHMNYNRQYVTDSKGILFSYLLNSKEDDFLMSGHLQTSVIDNDNEEMTLLQLASSKGLVRAVEELLKLGAIIDRTTSRNKDTPLEIAAKEGYHEVIEALLKHINDIPPKALLIALQQADTSSSDPARDYSKCVELLLERPLPDVNFTEKNSLLHSAIRYGGSEATLALLRKGASLATKNAYGFMPVEDIDADTMEMHLDECLEANLNKGIENENYEVVFNYKSLVPPGRKHSVEQKTGQDLEMGSSFLEKEIQDFNFETEAIYFMSKSPELRHLLTHPVITSFLYMKWLRLSCFFYANLAFYLMFCLSLLLYVFISYNVENTEKTPVDSLLLILLCITFTILFLRELFQILVSPKTYFFSFENWLELVLILFTAVILFQKSPSDSVKKQVSALTILLAAFEVVLLIGQHPKMSTNIEMLRTVSYNFFKFFIWYAILIVAFALSFYVLFKEGGEEKDDTAKNSTSDGDKEEQDFFLDPGGSLFKTIVMLTGEFDASDINFHRFPLTSHIVFALFIFMIAIILFNLLNGLAVSDTQMIKSNAELVGHIVRIQHIHYVENMLLGNLLPQSLLKCLQGKCCCLSVPINKFTIMRPFAERVCLFPYYLKDYRLKVLPNRQGKVVMPNENVMDDYADAHCITDCKYIYLDGKTTKRTKTLIRKQKRELEQSKATLEMEQRQDEIRKEQQQRIDEILQKLEILNNNLYANNYQRVI